MSICTRPCRYSRTGSACFSPVASCSSKSSACSSCNREDTCTRKRMSAYTQSCSHAVPVKMASQAWHTDPVRITHSLQHVERHAWHIFPCSSAAHIGETVCVIDSRDETELAVLESTVALITETTQRQDIKLCIPQSQNCCQWSTVSVL